jgi:uncharacterized integral membrane protein (TIGR00697 family)
MPRITFASFCAFLLSQFHDVWAFDFWKKKLPATKWLWIRNNASTMVSQIIDSIVFSLIAFAGMFEKQILIEIIVTTYIMKFIVAVCDTPCVYIAKWWFVKGKIKEL